MMRISPYKEDTIIDNIELKRLNVLPSNKNDLPSESRSVLMIYLKRAAMLPIDDELKKLETLHGCKIKFKVPMRNPKKAIIFEIKGNHAILRYAQHDLVVMLKTQLQAQHLQYRFATDYNVPELFALYYLLYPQESSEDYFASPADLLKASAPPSLPPKHPLAAACTCVERSVQRMLQIPVAAPFCQCPCTRCEKSQDSHKHESESILKASEGQSVPAPRLFSEAASDRLPACSCRQNWIRKISGATSEVEKCPCPCVRCQSPHDVLLRSKYSTDQFICPCPDCKYIRAFKEISDRLERRALDIKAKSDSS
ncbi:unnamed protein product [Caenorhabditis auriculariae]|uniref:Uncharacterized protein n=1 Tax=Caenorhabditis auriculariae TaxID=2777116 RepID=A0A8S1H0D0_9PELO|nr:unnamed protein product [Caenorhabditis auriculariae]